MPPEQTQPDSLAALLDSIPDQGQEGSLQNPIVPDSAAIAEQNDWKKKLHSNLHNLITSSLWFGGCLIAVILLIRTLHLILPEKEMLIFGKLAIKCWLTKDQISSIDHLIVSGGIISLVGSRVGKSVSDNMPY